MKALKELNCRRFDNSPKIPPSPLGLQIKVESWPIGQHSPHRYMKGGISGRGKKKEQVEILITINVAAFHWCFYDSMAAPLTVFSL